MKNIIFIISLNICSFASYPELLFNGNCITCHNIDKSISAPSIKMVQDNYKRAFPKRDDFVKYMSLWVENPNSKTSIMQESIKKYKLMPELAYDLESLEIISAYIYHTNFNKLLK